MAGVLGLAGAVTAVVAAGRTLPFPSHLDLTRVALWAHDAGPIVGAFTALRAVGGVLIVWLVVTTVAGVITRRMRLVTVTRVVDRVSLPIARRFARALAGAALVAASLTPVGPAGAQARPAAVMHDLGPVPTTTAASTTPPPTRPMPVTPPSSVTMRGLDPAASVPEADEPRPGSWLIRPGDTLWHVAEVVTRERSGPAAGPAETRAELERIVAANADRLAVPGNADLVFPGQVFLLP
jgi:hypothetical protein